MLYEAQDRITFALEGAVLAAEDALDAIRERILLALAVLAAALGIGAIALLSGGDAQPAQGAAFGQPLAAAAGEPEATVIDEAGFSLSLPADWSRVQAPDGASFAATSPDGFAKTTLWAERAPALGFDAFVDQSMRNLDEIGSNVRISDEVGGSSLASRVTELRADVPLDGGVSASYHVVLRGSGPFRYYLATSLPPGASPQLAADAELLATSFRPQLVPEKREASSE